MMHINKYVWQANNHLFSHNIVGTVYTVTISWEKLSINLLEIYENKIQTLNSEVDVFLGVRVSIVSCLIKWRGMLKSMKK